jgi:hypothetical protein
MRYCNDIAISKTVIHVIDGNSDEPLIGNQIVELDEETYMYLHNHIHKALKREANSKGEFLVNTAKVYTELNGMMSGGNFLECSQKIARNLFKVVKSTLSAPSGDLLVSECLIEGKKVIALLFMEYKTSFTHDIKFEQSDFKVDIKPYTVSLPSKGQRLNRYAFFTEANLSNCNSCDYEMVMLERSNLDENGEKVRFFISDFLQATAILDNTDVTRDFRSATEKWIRKNMKEDIGRAIEIRSGLDDQYVNCVEVNITDTVNNVIDSVEERDKFLMKLENAGIDTDKPFELDKKWIEKKFKQKTLKTDTGFTIKGDFDIFDDSSRLEIQYNGDGTVNYIIKQVRNIHQM